MQSQNKDIIGMICKFLDYRSVVALGATCKHLNKMTQGQKLNCTMRIRSNAINFVNAVENYVITSYYIQNSSVACLASKNVTHITLVYDVNNEEISNYPEYFPNLKSLFIVSNAKCQVFDYQNIAGFTNLETLHCNIFAHHIVPDTFIMPKLRHLVTGRIQYSSLKNILNGARNLHELSIDIGYTITYENCTILSEAKCLRKLQIMNRAYYPGDFVMAVTRMLPQLEHLYVRMMSKDALLSMISNMQNLHTLEIPSSTALSNGILKTIMESMKNLKKINISDCMLVSVVEKYPGVTIIQN